MLKAGCDAEFCMLLFDDGFGWCCVFFFSSRRRHTRYWRDWSSDVCSSDLTAPSIRTALRKTFRFGDDRSERSEEHTSELQSRQYLVCRLLLEKKKKKEK